MGNTNLLPATEDVRLQVTILKRRDIIFRAHTLPPDNAYAAWMKAAMHLRWVVGRAARRITETLRPAWNCHGFAHPGMVRQAFTDDFRCWCLNTTLRAMWCVPASYTQDAVGATVYVGKKKDALIIYVVEAFNAQYDVDRVFNGLHHGVWMWWRTASFGISVQEYLNTAEHLLGPGSPFHQLIPKTVRAAVRNRREGIYLPEHTITLYVTHLQAVPRLRGGTHPNPLAGDVTPHIAQTLWTEFIQDVQVFLCLVQLSGPDTTQRLCRHLLLWLRVYIERMLVTPPTRVPANGPPVVLDLLDQLAPWFPDQPGIDVRGIFAEYRMLLQSAEACAIAPEVVVLEDRRYRIKPIYMDSKAFLVCARGHAGHARRLGHRLQFWRHDVGFALSQNRLSVL